MQKIHIILSVFISVAALIIIMFVLLSKYNYTLFQNIAQVLPIPITDNLSDTENLPAPVTHILTVSSSGGLCPDGICTSSLAIFSSGWFTYKDNTREGSGFISQKLIGKTIEEIIALDFNTIPDQPINFVCPVVFDGQEFIYEFHTVGKTIRSCSHNTTGVKLFESIGNISAEAFTQI